MRSAIVALLLLLAVAADARACSCAAGSPQQRMADSDAAFIGTVTAVRSEPATTPTPTFVRRVRVYTIAVDKAYKGDVGATAEVRGEDTSSGAMTSCGEHYEIGDTLGGFFEGPPQEWFIFTCNRATREELEAGARGFPEPLGSGRAVALLAGPFGSAAFAALDSRGRVVAYAGGAGTGFGPVRLSVCPGGRYVVESGPVTTRTRRLSDLHVVRGLGRRSSGDVRCLDRRGTVAIVASPDRIERVRGRSVRTLWRGRAEVAAAGPRVSVVGGSGRALLVDSRTGRTRRLPTTDARAVSVSPDGRTVAVLGSELAEYSTTGANTAGRAARAHTRDITWDRRGRAMALADRAGGAFVRGRLWWVRDGKLRMGSRTAGEVPDAQTFPPAVVPLARATAVADPSRFNPSASGGSPPRARRARAGGGAPRAACRTA